LQNVIIVIKDAADRLFELAKKRRLRILFALHYRREQKYSNKDLAANCFGYLNKPVAVYPGFRTGCEIPLTAAFPQASQNYVQEKHYKAVGARKQAEIKVIGATGGIDFQAGNSNKDPGNLSRRSGDGTKKFLKNIFKAAIVHESPLLAPKFTNTLMHDRVFSSFG
jgi:hypothetical protein